MRRCLFIALLAAIAVVCTPSQAAEIDSKGQRDSVLLVAARHMMGPTFARSVVLVMFPTDTGPSGVILNKPSPMMLRDIWPDREDRQGRTDTLYIGGPVRPDGLLFLFRMTPPPERAWWAIEDIYFSGDGDLLDQLLEELEPVAEQRFFAGFAGWAPGQLENEIARGDWHVLEADPEVIYDTEPGTLWRRMHQRATLLRASVSPLQQDVAHHQPIGQ